MSVAPLSQPMTLEHAVWPTVEVAGDLLRAEAEWIHTNGTGAYASSTVAQLNTRRYHGLLVAALDPPKKRHVILAHMDTSLQAGGVHHALETHQFPGVPPTRGYRYLTQFDQDPLPRWTWKLPSGVLEQTIALVHGHNAVVLRYVWRGAEAVRLGLRPLLALRPFHGLVREHGSMVQSVELRQGEVRVRPVPALPRVVFGHQATFVGSPDWWRRFEYLAEQARGLDFQEDLWTPGEFTQHLVPNVAAFVVVALDSLPKEPAAALMAEAECLGAAGDPGPRYSRTRRTLSIARGAFVAGSREEPAIIAGFPWFEVWGRDTLIALPGLHLVQGELEAARGILGSLIKHMADGLVPNRIPDAGEGADYHTADATLWLFEAARLYAEQAGSADPFLRGPLFAALVAAFEAALKGTRHNIRVTEEGLFAAGDRGFALTWMDAKIGSEAVTPRAGLPVELQALWTRACDTLAAFAAASGERELAGRARSAHERARLAFRARFWCEKTGYPYDVVSDDPQALAVRDARIRPNAIIALAVEPRLFDARETESMLAVAKRELVTSAGLRTLARTDKGYRGHYGGGVKERDRAYHEGTVWPFLLGFYVRAAIRHRPHDAAHRDTLIRLVSSAADNCLALGQVPELADGDPPHRPSGCVAQAWSVAELLRALAWDLA